MIAAYVFVLQTALAGIAVTQAAAASPSSDLPFVLCAEHAAAPDSLPDQPSKQALCEHCIACAATAVSLPAPDPAAAGIVRFAHRATAPPAPDAAVTPAWRLGFHPSRGPPRTA